MKTNFQNIKDKWRKRENSKNNLRICKCQLGIIYLWFERRKRPTQIGCRVSLKGKSQDEKILQNQDWIKENIKPHLSVEMKTIEAKDNKIVILIKVAKSQNPPLCEK